MWKHKKKLFKRSQFLFAFVFILVSEQSMQEILPSWKEEEKDTAYFDLAVSQTDQKNNYFQSNWNRHNVKAFRGI